ncbi:MAG: FAD-binding oxidoreductase [Rhodobacteraceae bacterium]|nr:FAD-binding oxidoreductase [Paracoccaceae bacterium]
MTNRTLADVIVIGAGLHGLSAALHLSIRGQQVIVLEKDYAGRHASGVNAGGVRRMVRDLAEIPLSVEAMKLWHEIEALVDDDCGFVKCGQAFIAETEAELDSLRERVHTVRDLGFEHEELIDADELRRLVPAIAPHCVGAITCRDDGAALPFKTVTAFRRRAEKLGARVISGAEVSTVSRKSGVWHVRAGGQDFEAPVIVNAAGAWGAKLAAKLDEPGPMEAHAPMLMITEPLEPFLTPVLGAVGRTLSFKQFDNGTVLIGGGFMGDADVDANRADTRLSSMVQSARTVLALFPQLQDVRIIRAWAGLEGKMPDMIPILGLSKLHEGVFHSFGYSYHGFQLSPITGRIIADLVLEGKTDLPIEPFRIDRFEDKEV